MKTNVEALKALYLKLGGSLTDTYSDIAGGIPVGEYDLISDCILACAKKGAGGGGGSDLPEPGADGNVITADDGEWVSAAPSGGEFIVNVTYDESGDEPQYISDKNAQQIVEAYENDKTIVCRVVISKLGTVASIPLLSAGSIEQVYLARFEGRVVAGEEMALDVVVTVYKEGASETVAYGESISYYLPILSPSDNGKVLGVSNGAFALVSNSATTVIDVVSDGQGGYTASVDGSPITLAQMLTLAAAKTDMKVVCEVDNGRYVSCPLISWDSSGIHFMGASIVNDKPATTYAICEDEGSGEAWSVGIVRTA